MHQSWYNRVIMYKMTSFLCICGPDCIRKYERTAPPSSIRVLLLVIVQHFCLLCPSGVAMAEDSHGHSRLSLSIKRQTVDKPCLERQGYVPNAVFWIAEFLKHWYRLGGIMWTSTLATAITTPKETDHNNTHNNNNCLCFQRWGCGEVSLQPTGSSTRWLLAFMCCWDIKM